MNTPSKRLLTLRSKLVAAVFCFLVVVVLLVFLLIYGQQTSLLQSQWSESLHAQARLLAENSQAAVVFSDSEDASSLLATLESNPAIEAARIVMNGEEWALYRRSSRDPVEFPLTTSTTLFTRGQLMVREPVLLGDGQPPIAQLELLASLRGYHQTIERMRDETLLFLLGAFFLALLLSRSAVRRLTDPVERLNRLVDAVSADPGVRHRVQIDTHDELANLGTALNTMLDRLQSRERELSAYRNDLEQLVQRRTAELERMTEEARAASKAKSSFLAHVSHEIRTPMNAIIGLSRLLKETPDAPQSGQWLEQMSGASEVLLAVINDILDYSKIEAGCLNLEPRPFRLQSSLDTLMSLFDLAVREKGISLSLQVDEGVPSGLVGDTLRLQQVLINLVSNAVKFTDAGGVSVHVQRVQGLDAKGQVMLAFAVRDSGIGIDPARQSALFTPFTQADDSITRRFGGTGLGLAICSQLVEMMSGRIWLESQPGQGSTFHFTARFGQPEAGCEVPSGPAQSTLAHWQGERVLLVEDVEVNRTIAVAMLQRLGLQVSTACDGIEALEILSSMDPDDPIRLVLMDIQMPRLDGLSTVRAIRSELGMQELPVIAMTAHSMSEDYQLSIDSGMNQHLVKPIQLEQLQAVISQWLPHDNSRKRHPVLDGVPGKLQSLSAVMDLKRGLQLHMGQSALYWQSLHVFYRDFADNADKIRQLLVSQDRKGLRRLAHSLRGVAASTGATDLAAVAAAVEARLEQGAPLQSAADDLFMAWQPVQQALHQVMADERSIRCDDELPALQARLLRLLGQADSASAEVLRCWQQQATRFYPVAWHPRIDAIVQAVDELEYEHATELLEVFLSEVTDKNGQSDSERSDR